MTTAYTSLLGLALPVTGELSGTWGDTVNNAITSLLDTAVAGTTTLSTDADVTLTTTTGASNQARQAILLCSGARTAARNITAPAQSKIYTVINATTGGYAVVIRGAGPTTGITIPAGQTAQVAWNGSDFVDASNYIGGNLKVNGNLSVTGTTTLTGAATLTANPTLSAGTANGVTYLNGSKVLTSGSALVFDGSSLGVGIATPSTVAGAWKAIELVDAGNCLVGGYGEIDLANNLKYDRVGGFSYVNTGYASRFTQIGGVFTWNSGTGTANAAAALNTVMQLKASGNLLVGGTTEFSGTRFVVAGANTATDTTGNAFVYATDTQAADVGGKLTLGGMYNSSTNAYYAFGGIAGKKENSTNNNVAGYLQFLTTTSVGALTDRGRIDSSGNWILGGATARTRLTLQAGEANAPTLGTASGGAFFGNSSVAYGTLFGTSGSGYGWIQQQRVDGTGTAYDLCLQPSGGNFMVGGTTGESKSNVFCGGSNGFSSGTLPPGMTIYGTASNGYGSMLSFKAATGDQGVSGIGAFRVSSYQTDLRFYTNYTNTANSFAERMRITASGYVGINNSDPDGWSRLSVGGTISSATTNNYYSTLAGAPYYNSGFWQGAAEVPNSGINYWVPIIGGAAVTSGQGYVTQAVFGVKKFGGATFASGAYIGVTNNSDAGPGREFLFDTGGNFSAPGSKSFRIPHPLPEKSETHELWHVALEGPSLDLIYRGTVDLVNGAAEVNIDLVSRMSDGTFVALTKDAQAFTSNESDWTPVRGSVNGNILSIQSQDGTATSSVSWMVIAKRKDHGALNEGTADENGEFITERLAG